MFFRLIIFFFTFLSISPVFADGISFGIHHLYNGPRPLGMGNAFVAVANDYNAIFYNPAGLSRRDDGEINMYMGGEISTQFLTFAQDMANAQSSGTASQKQTKVLQVIENQYGKAFGERLSMFQGIWVRPKWGIALLPMEMSVEETFHKAVGPSLNATVIMDTIGAFAYADDIPSFPGGRMSWGLTAKAVYRGMLSKQISFIELASDPNIIQTSDFKEGLGVDADLGFLYTPSVPQNGVMSLLRFARPTFGMVVRNLLEPGFLSNAKLYNKDGTEKPDKMYRVIDIGSRWEYPSFFLFSGRGVLDIRDILHPNFSTKKAVHLGFEFDWTMASWWRGAYRFGYSEGYYTAGISAMLTTFNLDLYTHAEDVGTTSNPVENRFYGARASFNW